MAPLSKYKGVFKAYATGAATVTTDYSSDVIDMQTPYTKNVGSHFTIDTPWRKSTEGGMQFDVTVTVRFSLLAASAYQVFLAWAIAGGSRVIEAYTPDTVTGSFKISGSAICVGPDNGIDVAGGSGDVQSMKFKFQSDGTWATAII